MSYLDNLGPGDLISGKGLCEWDNKSKGLMLDFW